MVATFLCIYLTTFAIYAIVVVHCLDNCCLLLKKRAREGGLSGSPWPQPSSGTTPTFTFWGHLFHTHFCALLLAPENNIFVKTCTQTGAQIHSKCNSKSLHFSAVFFLLFRSAQKSEHVFGPCLCAVQTTSGTDHMAHEMGGKIVRKGTQIHQESMTRTSPRKDIEKCGPRLDNLRNQCPTWSLNK